VRFRSTLTARTYPVGGTRSGLGSDKRAVMREACVRRASASSWPIGPCSPEPRAQPQPGPYEREECPRLVARAVWRFMSRRATRILSGVRKALVMAASVNREDQARRYTKDLAAALVPPVLTRLPHRALDGAACDPTWIITSRVRRTAA
jgi:hypothetical protein